MPTFPVLTKKTARSPKPLQDRERVAELVAVAVVKGNEHGSFGPAAFGNVALELVYPDGTQTLGVEIAELGLELRRRDG